jgi:hypothetical protein
VKLRLQSFGMRPKVHRPIRPVKTLSFLIFTTLRYAQLVPNCGSAGKDSDMPISNHFGVARSGVGVSQNCGR